MIDVKDCLAQSSETKLWENIDCEDQNIQTQVKGVFHELPGIFFTKQWNKNNFPSHWSIFFAHLQKESAFPLQSVQLLNDGQMSERWCTSSLCY